MFQLPLDLWPNRSRSRAADDRSEDLIKDDLKCDMAKLNKLYKFKRLHDLVAFLNPILSLHKTNKLSTVNTR